MIEITPNKVWQEYQKGRQYKTDIGLFETVRTNENFYIGKQWEGVNAPDLPKPVLNFLKRVVNFCNASIVSDDIAVNFTPHSEDEQEQAIAKALARQVEKVFENTKIRAKNRDILRDALVDGDGCLFLRFNPDIETGQDAKGDIEAEIIQNINVYFGNPYISEVQQQPYIIIAKRMTVGELKAEAEANGRPQEDIDSITSDTDDAQGEKGDSQLSTKLIRLWKEDGTIHCVECTEKAIIREAWDTEYKLYPLAWLNWEKIKSSYHGQAILTGLIPNQIQVNRLFAMTIRSVEMNAFPKVVYDPSKIKRWTNRAGEAIEAVGGVGGLPDAFTSVRGADVSPQVMDIINQTVTMTRDFMGASDAALGNVRPDNTSAIIAVQQASAVPLELNRLAFYQFVEDYVRVMLDIMRADYGKRTITLDEDEAPVEQIEIDGMVISQPVKEIMFDFGSYSTVNYLLNVDVGAGSYWSELMQLQTMDNLFSKGLISDATAYLESIPSKYLRNKEKLIQGIKERQEMQEQMMQMQQMQAPTTELPPELMQQM